MQKVVINRPWTTSFPFDKAPYSTTHMDQIHKLARNLVASLDLGCPNAKHTQTPDNGVSINGYDDRGRYLEWVKTWKYVYKNLSSLIHQVKTFRRTVKFKPLNAKEEELWFRLNPGNNLTAREHLGAIARVHLPRLAETAQILLNARYNAKMAAAERRRRTHGLHVTPAAPVVLEDDSRALSA